MASCRTARSKISRDFPEEEVEQLEVYLMEHADELMEKAKEMSKLTNLL